MSFASCKLILMVTVPVFCFKVIVKNQNTGGELHDEVNQHGRSELHHKAEDKPYRSFKEYCRKRMAGNPCASRTVLTTEIARQGGKLLAMEIPQCVCDKEENQRRLNQGKFL